MRERERGIMKGKWGGGNYVLVAEVVVRLYG